ncbi:MAG: metallophosphoesterase family protein [Actinomycetota bacterium]
MRRSLIALMLAVTAACSNQVSPPRAEPSATTPTATASPSPVAFRFAAVGDIGDGSVAEKRVADAIAAEHDRRPLDLLLLLGDMVYPDGDPAEVDKKFRAPYASVLGAGIEVAAVLGNHDVMTDAGAIADAFGMPGRWYKLTRGPVDLFALDSSTGTIGASQLAWFEAALTGSTAKWKVVFMHVPAFSAGRHGANPALQQALVPLLDRFDVSLVITGHDHDYQRSVPIRGTVHVVSGGGCCPRPVGTASYTARSATGLHFVVVEANDERLSLEAIAVDGKILDRSVIAGAEPG